MYNHHDLKQNAVITFWTLPVPSLCWETYFFSFLKEITNPSLQVLQIDDVSRLEHKNQLWPFKTEDSDNPPSNSMLTSTKGQKGQKGERVS